MIQIKTGVFQKLFAISLNIFGIFLLIAGYIGFFTDKYPNDNPYLIFPLFVFWLIGIFVLLKFSIQVKIDDSTIEFKNIITKSIFKYQLTELKNIEIIDTINTVYLIFSFSNKNFKLCANYLQFEGDLPKVEFSQNSPDKFNIREAYKVKSFIYKIVGREFTLEI